MSGFTGKVAIVTGGGRDGRAVAGDRRHLRRGRSRFVESAVAAVRAELGGVDLLSDDASFITAETMLVSGGAFTRI